MTPNSSAIHQRLLLYPFFHLLSRCSPPWVSVFFVGVADVHRHEARGISRGFSHDLVVRPLARRALVTAPGAWNGSEAGPTTTPQSAEVISVRLIQRGGVRRSVFHLLSWRSPPADRKSTRL